MKDLPTPNISYTYASVYVHTADKFVPIYTGIYMYIHSYIIKLERLKAVNIHWSRVNVGALHVKVARHTHKIYMYLLIQVGFTCTF